MVKERVGGGRIVAGEWWKAGGQGSSKVTKEVAGSGKRAEEACNE